MANKPILWTKEEIELLNENYPILSKNELINLFPNRSYKSISGKAEKIGLKKIGDLSVKKWTQEEIDIMIDKYTNNSKEEMLNLLPNRTWREIQHKSSRLNVRKYSEYKEDRHSWTEEEIKEIVENRGYIFHATFFDQFNKRKITVECKDGIVQDVYFDNFKNGSEAGSKSLTRRKTYSEIKELITSEGYKLLTKENEYINTKSELLTLCPYNHEWKTTGNNFRNGNRCYTCFLNEIGKNNLLNIDFVRGKFNEFGFILLDNQTYVGGSAKMDCKCKIHDSDDCVQKLSYNQVVNMKVQCVHCRKAKKLKEYEIIYEQIVQDFIEKGITLKTTKENYIDMRINMQNEYLYFECIEHSHFGLQKVKEKSLDTDKSICKYCAKKSISGKNHYKWNGGISRITEYLRHKIQPWKFDSMKEYNFTCFLTGRTDNLIIHHKYSFSNIVKECLKDLNFRIADNINCYSDDELNSLTELCLQKHYDYGYGICLNSDVHDLFHYEYSNFYFSPEDFDEFVERFKNGEFNNLKENILI